MNNQIFHIIRMAAHTRFKLELPGLSRQIWEVSNGTAEKETSQKRVAMTSQQTRAINIQWADVQMKTFGAAVKAWWLLTSVWVCVVLKVWVQHLYTPEWVKVERSAVFLLVFTDPGSDGCLHVSSFITLKIQESV